MDLRIRIRVKLYGSKTLFQVTFYQDHVTYYFTISEPYVKKILENNKTIDEKPLKKDCI